jgi:hypothetical protein
MADKKIERNPDEQIIAPISVAFPVDPRDGMLGMLQTTIDGTGFVFLTQVPHPTLGTQVPAIGLRAVSNMTIEQATKMGWTPLASPEDKPVIITPETSPDLFQAAQEPGSGLIV